MCELSHSNSTSFSQWLFWPHTRIIHGAIRTNMLILFSPILDSVVDCIEPKMIGAHVPCLIIGVMCSWLLAGVVFPWQKGKYDIYSLSMLQISWQCMLLADGLLLVSIERMPQVVCCCVMYQQCFVYLRMMIPLPRGRRYLCYTEEGVGVLSWWHDMIAVSITDQ